VGVLGKEAPFQKKIFGEIYFPRVSSSYAITYIGNSPFIDLQPRISKCMAIGDIIFVGEFNVGTSCMKCIGHDLYYDPLMTRVVDFQWEYLCQTSINRVMTPYGRHLVILGDS
jgi:hypothetical protein